MKYQLLGRTNIRFRHLRYFIAVARLNSVTAAAVELYTSQPAVSRAMTELEDALNTKLFDRSGGRIELNSEGRKLLGPVTAALEQIEHGLVQVSGDLANQVVRVCVLPSVIRTILPSIVQRFKEHYPEVLLHLDGSVTAKIWAKLLHGDIDVIVGRLSSSDRMQGLNFTHLFSERLGFYCRSAHPLAGKIQLHIDEIADHVVLLPERGLIIRDEYEKFMISTGANPFPNVVETNSFELLPMILPLSDAVAFCASGLVQHEVRNGTLICLPVEGPQLQESIGVTTLPNRRMSEPAKLFVSLLEEEMQPAPDGEHD